MGENKIVWFFGPTAVGKDTSIHSLASNPTHFLANKLSLSAPIVVCQEALDLRHQDRAGLESTVAALALKNPTVLIKGQGDDIAHLDVPHKLKVLLPNHEHIFLYLDASSYNLSYRRNQRDPDIPWGLENAQNDRAANLGLATQLENTGISFIWLSNDSDELLVIPKPEG